MHKIFQSTQKKSWNFPLTIFYSWCDCPGKFTKIWEVRRFEMCNSEMKFTAGTDKMTSKVDPCTDRGVFVMSMDLYSIGTCIQKEMKELTKVFIMISN